MRHADDAAEAAARQAFGHPPVAAPVRRSMRRRALHAARRVATVPTPSLPATTCARHGVLAALAVPGFALRLIVCTALVWDLAR